MATFLSRQQEHPCVTIIEKPIAATAERIARVFRPPLAGGGRPSTSECPLYGALVSVRLFEA